jgi:hypothetical protein
MQTPSIHQLGDFFFPPLLLVLSQTCAITIYLQVLKVDGFTGSLPHPGRGRLKIPHWPVSSGTKHVLVVGGEGVSGPWGCSTNSGRRKYLYPGATTKPKRTLPFRPDVRYVSRLHQLRELHPSRGRIVLSNPIVGIQVRLAGAPLHSPSPSSCRPQADARSHLWSHCPARHPRPLSCSILRHAFGACPWLTQRRPILRRPQV